MKNLLVIILLLCAVLCKAQTGEKPTMVGDALQIQFVCKFDGAGKGEILNGMLNYINDWNSSARDESQDKHSIKKKIKKEYTNIDEGVAIYNGKLFLGCHTDVAWVYLTEADFNLSIKAKDGAALITMKVPSIVYWAQNFYHSYPVREVYPEVTTKKYLYKDKKNLREFGKLAPEKMTEFVNGLKNGARKQEIDF